MFVHYIIEKHNLNNEKERFIFLLVATAIFLPFFVSDDAYEWYKTFNATHGMVMSFLKFAILLPWAK